MTNKWVYLLLSGIFFVLGIILSHTYRIYIYENHIFDFHIADTLGNLVAVPSAVCFILAVSSRKWKLKALILKIVLIYIAYEFLGLFGLHGTFYYFDMIATVISGVVTYFILHKVIDKIEIT